MTRLIENVFILPSFGSKFAFFLLLLCIMISLYGYTSLVDCSPFLGALLLICSLQQATTSSPLSHSLRLPRVLGVARLSVRREACNALHSRDA